MSDESKREMPSHEPGTRKGEEIRAEDGQEAGRHDRGTTGAGRPSGGREPRDSTAINPDEAGANDPESPEMPPA